MPLDPVRERKYIRKDSGPITVLTAVTNKAKQHDVISAQGRWPRGQGSSGVAVAGGAGGSARTDVGVIHLPLEGSGAVAVVVVQQGGLLKHVRSFRGGRTAPAGDIEAVNALKDIPPPVRSASHEQTNRPDVHCILDRSN